LLGARIQNAVSVAFHINAKTQSGKLKSLSNEAVSLPIGHILNPCR